MKHSYFIIDDQQWFINHLNQLLAPVEDFVSLGSATNEEMALAMLLEKKLRPDVLFLDIMMDNINGLDFAEQIKHLGIAIVFITSDRSFAVDAFRYGIAYLVKTFDQKEFEDALDKVRWYFNAGHPEMSLEETILSIKLGKKGNYLAIKLEELLFVEGSSNYMKLHMANGKFHLAYTSLNVLEKRLASSGFVRIHKTYIVNLRFIGAIANKTVTVGKLILPIGDTYYEQFINKVKKTLP